MLLQDAHKQAGGGWIHEREGSNRASTMGLCSVATVMTNVLHKNGIMVSEKLAKIVRIFVDIGHIKNRGAIYWPKRIGWVIPTQWSSHNFSHKNYIFMKNIGHDHGNTTWEQGCQQQWQHQWQ